MVSFPLRKGPKVQRNLQHLIEQAEKKRMNTGIWGVMGFIAASNPSANTVPSSVQIRGFGNPCQPPVVTGFSWWWDVFSKVRHRDLLHRGFEGKYVTNVQRNVQRLRGGE